MIRNSHRFACHSASGKPCLMIGSGHVRERLITVPEAPEFVICDAFVAELTVDPLLADDIRLCIRADDNLLPRIRAEVRDGTVRIRLVPGNYADLTELSIRATVGPLTGVRTVGTAQAVVHRLAGRHVTLTSTDASRLHASGRVDEWSLRAGGISRLHASVARARKVTTDVSAASQTRLRGNAEKLLVRARGAARLNAGMPGFKTGSAHVDLAGPCRVDVGATSHVVGHARFPGSFHQSAGGSVDVESGRDRSRQP